jgi:hypothetical protein
VYARNISQAHQKFKMVPSNKRKKREGKQWKGLPISNDFPSSPPSSVQASTTPILPC